MLLSGWTEPFTGFITYIRPSLSALRRPAVSIVSTTTTAYPDPFLFRPANQIYGSREPNRK